MGVEEIDGGKMRVDGEVGRGLYIAVEAKYAIYQTLGNGKTKFVGITQEKVPCRCPYCTVGGLGWGAVNYKVNSEKNCKNAAKIKKLEEEMK